MLGRTIEGIKTNELIPFLTETGNYPMKRYIYKSDINDGICKKYEYPFAQRFYADTLDYMICDDDLNYVVLGQKLIDKYSRDFLLARRYMAMARQSGQVHVLHRRARSIS